MKSNPGIKPRWLLLLAAEWFFVCLLVLLWYTLRPIGGVGRPAASPDEVARARDSGQQRGVARPVDKIATAIPPSAPQSERGLKAPAQPAAMSAESLAKVESPTPATGPVRTPSARPNLGSAHAIQRSTDQAAAAKPLAPESVQVAPSTIHKSIEAPTRAPSEIPPAAVAATQSVPRANNPLDDSSTGQLPYGVSITTDGELLVGMERVKPWMDKTNGFQAVDNGQRRYIAGRHVYAIAQDLLHGGSPVASQQESYTMWGDSSWYRPSEQLSKGVTFTVRNRGSVTGMTTLPPQGVANAWSSENSSLRAVPVSTAEAIGAAVQNVANNPQLLLAPPPIDNFASGPWGNGYEWRVTGEIPRCDPTYSDPVYSRVYNPYRNLFSPQNLALVRSDARVTSVTLDYQGTSTPIEVVGDLKGARNALAGQTLNGDNRQIQQMLLPVYDSEITLWEAVVVSGNTAKAAQQAWSSNDAPRCLELCKQYESQIAPYRRGPRFNLFAREEKSVAQLADQLKSRLAAMQQQSRHSRQVSLANSSQDSQPHAAL